LKLVRLVRVNGHAYKEVHMLRYTLGCLLLLCCCDLALAQNRAAKPVTVKNDAHPLLGIWHKDGLVFIFERQRLIIASSSAPEMKSALLVADYGITRDNIVYGIITREKLPDDLPIYISLIDETFRFRFRIEDDQLTLKDFSISPPRLLGSGPRLSPLPRREQTVAAEENKCKEADDPETKLTATLLMLQQELQGTYDRMSKEELEKQKANQGPNGYAPAPPSTAPGTLRPSAAVPMANPPGAPKAPAAVPGYAPPGAPRSGATPTLIR
jgi:hypothetical protein